MEKKKKQWSQPQLIVMVRGRQNERVLVDCKLASSGSYGITSALYCYLTAVCTACSDVTGS